MKNCILALPILAVTLCGSFSGARAGSPDPGRAAAALNQQSKANLGVSIRALGLLFDTDPGNFELKYGLVRSGSWPFLLELQRAGLVTVTPMSHWPNGTAPTSEWVSIRHTSKGQQVHDALAEH